MPNSHDSFYSGTLPRSGKHNLYDGPLFWISIFIIVAVITTLTIIFRILKIARTNPAEVIKNE